MMEYHVPALLNACIEGLNIDPMGSFVDATFGGGGHSAAIINHLTKGHLYGFDQDEDACENIASDSRFTFVHANFRFLRHFMRYHNVDKLDGILADLGVSFHHFDTVERGFSFRFDALLDMRMNKKSHLTAAKVVNEYSVDRLTKMFRDYGDFHMARKLAFEIDKARSVKPLRTTRDLKDLVEPLFSTKSKSKVLARLFQSIRMEVNHEVETLRVLLKDGTELLKPGGRFAVITYHSVEDKLVKNFFRFGDFDGKKTCDFYGNVEAPLKPVGKMIIPSAEEVMSNPRSRSAKLRIAEKL